MIIVTNKKTYRGNGTYIGRPSPLGDPFIIGRDGDRADVIEKYRTWLRDQWRTNGPAKRALLHLVQEYRKTGELRLICWCAPAPCHGDVIKDAVELLSAEAVCEPPGRP